MYVVMEECEGDLFDLLHHCHTCSTSSSERHPLTAVQRLNLAFGAASGVVHLHAANCVHCDIKSVYTRYLCLESVLLWMMAHHLCLLAAHQ